MNKREREALMELMRVDPSVFRKHVVIDTDGSPKRFGDVELPFQAKDFKNIDPMWRFAIGVGPETERNRAVMLRSRAGSKTSDAALQATWAVSMSPREVHGIIAAGSKEQAALLIRACRRLHRPRANEWFASDLVINRWSMVNKETGSDLIVVTADAGLNMGHLCDFCIADELTSWPDAGEELWHVLFSTAAKRNNCVLQILSNCGYLDTWQHRLCMSLRESPNCYYSQTDETQTTMAPRQVAEQIQQLPGLVADRLIRNIWVPFTGSNLDEAALQQCIWNFEPYPMLGADSTRREPDWRAMVGGVDLAATRDHAAVTVLAVNPKLNKIRVAWTKRFAPRNGAVDLVNVASVIKEVHARYQPIAWHFDPYEGRRLAQEFGRMGIRVVLESMQGANTAVMASALLTAINSHQLEIHESETDLIRDLRGMSIVEKNGVLRVVADRSSRGHCDQGFSLLVSLPAAQELTSRAAFDTSEISGGFAQRGESRNAVQVKVPHKMPSRYAIPFTMRGNRVIRWQ
jgi:hypothetical protein